MLWGLKKHELLFLWLLLMRTKIFLLFFQDHNLLALYFASTPWSPNLHRRGILFWRFLYINIVYFILLCWLTRSLKKNLNTEICNTGEQSSFVTPPPTASGEVSVGAEGSALAPGGAVSVVRWCGGQHVPPDKSQPFSSLSVVNFCSWG